MVMQVKYCLRTPKLIAMTNCRIIDFFYKKHIIQIAYLSVLCVFSINTSAKNTAYKLYQLKTCNDQYCFLVQANNAQSSYLSPDTTFLYDVTLKVFDKKKISLSNQSIRNFRAKSAYLIGNTIVVRELLSSISPDFSLSFNDTNFKLNRYSNYPIHKPQSK